MPVGLKIDLFSLQAVQTALPTLLDLLREYQLKATFFPALGPDPITRGGRLAQLFHTPVLIGDQAGDQLRRIGEDGHELGAVAHDVGGWRRYILDRDAAWTRNQLQHAVHSFKALFGERPRAVAAADFLINADVPGLESELGFDYAVDTRGLTPYLPVTSAGAAKCPQLPVTLPRIEDALAIGEPLGGVHQFLFMESQKPLLPGHLFSFTLLDPAHLDVLEKLFVMWMGSQRKVTPVRQLLEAVDVQRLAYHQAVLVKRVAGGPMYAAQGEQTQ